MDFINHMCPTTFKAFVSPVKFLQHQLFFSIFIITVTLTLKVSPHFIISIILQNILIPSSFSIFSVWNLQGCPYDILIYSLHNCNGSIFKQDKTITLINITSLKNYKATKKYLRSFKIVIFMLLTQVTCSFTFLCI